MPTPTETWNSYCDRSHAAAHHAPHAPPDLLDFSFALVDVSLEIANLARLMRDADECGAECGPTVRAHVDDMRQIKWAISALVADAEAEARLA